MIELNQNIKSYLYKKFNIIYHTNFLNFDRDFQLLFDQLIKTKKDPMDINDRIIIEHFDTDFYDNSLKTGLLVRNTIECLKQADIPFFSVIFVTNNYSLEEEINLLINKNQQKPTVLTTLSSRFALKNNYINFAIEPEKIIKSSICMMAGSKRSHRQSLYYYIKKNNLFSKIAVSYHNES
jgi:hypothetical protein